MIGGAQERGLFWLSVNTKIPRVTCRRCTETACLHATGIGHRALPPGSRLPPETPRAAGGGLLRPAVPVVYGAVRLGLAGGWGRISHPTGPLTGGVWRWNVE